MMTNFYKQHCENLRMLEQAIRTVQVTLREYISLSNQEKSDVYTKILSHLINSWVEVRLMKLLYEVGAFTDYDKERIIKCKNLEGKWKMSLNIAFCKAFKVKRLKNIVAQTTIPYTARSQYSALLTLIEGDLLESNAIRNRIAHGQWKYAFTNKMTNINKKLTRNLKTENILVLQFRLAMFKSLTQIIHDLAVSKPTFIRDFDTNYRKIDEQRRNSKTISYAIYKTNMVNKKKRGLVKREEAFFKEKTFERKPCYS